MRSFIIDSRLHTIMDVIEDALDYRIPAEPMDNRQQNQSKCLMEYHGEDGYVFRYPKGELLKQTTICHELMHPLLRLEGWPCTYIADEISRDSVTYETLNSIRMLIEHPQVWDMGRRLGFAEDNDHIEFLTEDVIPLLSKMPDGSQFSFPIRFPQKIPWVSPLEELQEGVFHLAIYVAQALHLPGGESLRPTVASLAKKKCPQVFQVSAAVLQALHKHSPISPQTCLPALESICAVLQIPKGTLLHEAVPAVSPHLFSDVFQKLAE